MKTTLNGTKSNIFNIWQIAIWFGLEHVGWCPRQLEYNLIPILEVRITGGGRAKNIREVLMRTLGLGFGLSNSNLVSHGELG